jgi:two-component system sensor histidine kinase VicK
MYSFYMGWYLLYFVFLPAKQISVKANRDKISEVFQNLISNAVKLYSLATAITVSCETMGHSACICVCDSGYGIQAQDQQKLVDRYYRIEGP